MRVITIVILLFLSLSFLTTTALSWTPHVKIKFYAQIPDAQHPFVFWIYINTLIGDRLKVLADHWTINQSGVYSVEWDGTDGSGNEASTGIYYCQIIHKTCDDCAPEVKNQKITLVK